MHRTTLLEVRMLEESDLRAFAAGAVDGQTAEAIEAYLLHHPEATRRVEAYRRAAEGPLPKRRLLAVAEGGEGGRV